MTRSMRRRRTLHPQPLESLGMDPQAVHAVRKGRGEYALSPLRGLGNRLTRFRGFHPRLSAAAAARPMRKSPRCVARGAEGDRYMFSDRAGWLTQTRTPKNVPVPAHCWTSQQWHPARTRPTPVKDVAAARLGVLRVRLTGGWRARGYGPSFKTRRPMASCSRG